MTPALRRSPCLLLNHAIVALLLAASARAQIASPQSAPATLPSETPAHFKVATASWDYERREVMIPMRDGARLHTVILVPQGAKSAPILLTRTPYSASELTSHAESSHL
ncbi:MAG: glutaryl-7-ACA acylase, partial [Acidobacteria bacterium Pan2503]|nr:glutaryl-7-ACA acylase [Candidatus Acidoferrum panamensis]